jgi:hypothetical protein
MRAGQTVVDRVLAVQDPAGAFADVGQRPSDQRTVGKPSASLVQFAEVSLNISLAPELDAEIVQAVEVSTRSLRKLDAYRHAAFFRRFRALPSAMISSISRSNTRPASTSSMPFWISARSHARRFASAFSRFEHAQRLVHHTGFVWEDARFHLRSHKGLLPFR